MIVEERNTEERNTEERDTQEQAAQEQYAEEENTEEQDTQERDEAEMKKEKVLHTRISEPLEEEIKKRASNLGISASNLVRNVLQHTFGLVGDIVQDSANIAKSARGEFVKFKASTSHSPSIPEQPVWGWQEAILNLNAVCDECNTILPKGIRAGIGIVDGAQHRPVLCKNCLDKMEEMADASADEKS